MEMQRKETRKKRYTSTKHYIVHNSHPMTRRSERKEKHRRTTDFCSWIYHILAISSAASHLYVFSTSYSQFI